MKRDGNSRDGLVVKPWRHRSAGRARCPQRAAHAFERQRRRGRDTAPDRFQSSADFKVGMACHLATTFEFASASPHSDAPQVWKPATQQTRRSAPRNPVFAPAHSLALVASFLCCLALQADPLDTWHVRGPGPTTNQLNAITYGGSGFVAAGNAGTLAASPDGYQWELLSTGVETNLQGVAWGGGAYVVVGDGGAVFTSPDGVKWTPRESGTSANLQAISYGTNVFVAVGAGATVVTSTNLGQTWHVTQGVIVGTLNAVIHDEGVFVAAGEDGWIVTSPDGFQWTMRHAGGGLNLRLLVHEGGTFIAYPFATNVLFSTDGFEWVPGGDAWGRYLRAVAAGTGDYAYAGVGINTEANYWAYWDYVWHAYRKATRSRLLAIAFGNGIYACVGEGGTIEIGDGGWWAEIWCGEWPWSGEDLSTVISKGDPSWWPRVRFWAGAANGEVYFYPTNGDWGRGRQLAAVWGAVSGMATSSNIIVAVDSEGMVITSTDPQAYGLWTQTDPRVGQPLRGVAYGCDRFVAVGDAGTAITSTTGTNWTKVESGTSSNLWGIAFLNHQFVAVGEKTVITSPDGLFWEAHDADANLRGVTFKHGLYAAVGLEGKILTSPDSRTWTPQDSGTTNDLYAIAHDAHHFMAVGNNATILTGRDGTNWTARTSPRQVTLRGVAFGDGTFVAVGDRWTVLESDPMPQGPSFGPVTLVEGGRVQLSIQDIDPGQFEIQISPDLSAWSTWTNVIASENRLLVIDPEFAQTGHRFYRAVAK